MSYSTYSDKTLTCRDCGNPFTFTEGEQEFFAQKGFANEPSRCTECRTAHRGQQRRGTSYSSGGFDRGSREMFTVSCSACGQDAQVPFQPREDKPVYCSSCFEQRRSGYR